VTPEVHKRYLYFKYTPGKTTIMTLHDLRELCQLTKNRTEGRPVAEKAINALSDQLRKVLEAETIQWTGSRLTLDYLKARARAIDEALQVRELERAPLELAKAAAAKSLGQLHVKEEGKAQNSSAGSSKRPREDCRRRNKGNKKEGGLCDHLRPCQRQVRIQWQVLHLRSGGTRQGGLLPETKRRGDVGA
jgi:hypothetical protein